ncbi:hypothetical protein DM02DRAFT_626661 [Periconia macrospinosa]|uniref:Uncharacterized protein n=1 Tax=Periconia macrospinosa TaxID=97972 RepID=A0A2V1DWB0_9PLEO|nr:hypothetical protein DM02DRAFT_626661 [Periconia macrospinosa]
MPHSQKMDIQRWLNDTVTPEQHWALPDEAAPPCNHSKRTEGANQRRERTTSDSSFLDIASQTKPAPLLETGNRVGKSISSDAMHPGGQTGSDRSAHDYTRQPRRKTRIERYEATSKDKKKRGVHARHDGHGESTKAKRKAKRRRVDKERSEMVQSFHANNVSTDRLTLKPRAKLGLFNNGRASSPVKGRGLPDLVFSEMKFLKRRDGDQAEPQYQPGKQSNRSKHSHTQPNEEISAYFTVRRSAQAEDNTATHAKDGPLIQKSALQTPSIADNVVPTIEIAERAPVLRPENVSSRDNSESYISWSESIHAPSVVQACQSAGSPPNFGQLDSIHHHHAKGAVDDRRLLHAQDAPPNIIKHIPDINEIPPHASSGQHSTDDRIHESYSPSQSNSLLRRTKPANRASKPSKLSKEAYPPYIRSPLRNDDTRPVQMCQGGRIPPSLGSRVTHSPVSHERHIPTESAHYRRVIRDIAAREDGVAASMTLGNALTDHNNELDEPQLEHTRCSMDQESKTSKVPVLGVPRTLRDYSPLSRRTSNVPGLDMNAIHRPYVHGPSMPSIYEQQEQGEFYEQDPLYIQREYRPSYTEDETFLDEEGRIGDSRIISYEPNFVSYETEALGNTNPLDSSREVNGVGSSTSVTHHVDERGFWRRHRLF